MSCRTLFPSRTPPRHKPHHQRYLLFNYTWDTLVPTTKQKLKWNTRIVLNHMGLFGYLRLGIQRIFRKPHEYDFELFRHFSGDDGLFLDIGANIGQSAISFAAFNKNSPIISFEPNQMLSKYLKFVKFLLGKRFSYFELGAGKIGADYRFYVPVVNGVSLDQEGTIDKSVLTDDQVTRNRICEATGSYEYQISEREVKIINIDSMNLAPMFVKIDVQGHEVAAIEGMKNTLLAHQPLVMVENGVLRKQYEPVLTSYGYEPFMYDSAKDMLVPVTKANEPLNVFYVPTGKVQDFRNKKILK